LPSLSEQNSIANFIRKLDERIELNHKINAELESLAKTLYDYWFVQFDFPDENGKPYKSSGGQMTMNSTLNRPIPTGWKVETMFKNSLLSIIKPKIDYFDGEKTYIATADVDGLSISDGSQITHENRESRANMQPSEYSVWFAKMKSSVKHIFVGEKSQDLIQNCIFSTGFMGLQADKRSFEYIASIIHSDYFEKVKDFNSSGATMEAVGNSSLKNIDVIIPSDDILQKYHAVMKPIFEKMTINRQQSQKLAQLRDWLLPMLMNGQVKVGG
jgi:type I restriction enzyme S subunit